MKFSNFIEALPRHPITENGQNNEMWSNGDFILCRTEEAANTVADFLEACGATDCACTGYYDPAEDKASGLTDEVTGFYYVDVS